MERTVFNPAQLQILDLMAYVESEDTLNEIKDMLSNYFAQKAEKLVIFLTSFPQYKDYINIDIFSFSGFAWGQDFCRRV